MWIMEAQMRVLLVTAGVLAVLASVDAVAFGARYRQAALQEATHQGNRLTYEVQYRLRKIGL
jgi:hypothetical protein